MNHRRKTWFFWRGLTSSAPADMICLVLLIVSAVLLQGCRAGASSQPFDQKKWHEGRESSPDLNVSPWMVDDLRKNHLRLGQSLTDVTNLLGHPEIRSSLGAGVRVRGAFLSQTVYIYHPGLHNGWLLHGPDPLCLYFGEAGQYLKEWIPMFPLVEPVSAAPSEATRETLSNGGLHIGNLRFAGTVSQFERLLGPPDERRIESHLEYFLGKRTRFARDDVFLELHFDKDQKLNRITCEEH